MALDLQRKEFDSRFQAIFKDRLSWEPVWKDIRDYVLPRRGRFDNLKPNQGKRRDEAIIDSAPLYAIRTLAAGIMSGLTSPSRSWFRLILPDQDIMENDDARWWLDQCQKILLHWFQKIKFYDSAYSVYEEIAGFGTGCMGMFEMKADGKLARCQVFTVGTYALGIGPDGQVDTFCRKVWYTAKQMVEEFGKTNCSREVLDAYNRQGTEEWFEVWHMVEPNDQRIENMAGVQGMPYRSVYWEPSTREDKKFLAIRGFEEFPIFAPRWDTTDSSDTYGKSPGWDALGDCKMLQKIAYDGLIGLEKEINPPVLAPASMRQTGVSLIPGGMTYYGDSRVLNNDMVRPLLQVKPNLDAMAAWLDRLENKIQRAFYSDLFLMFTDTDRKEITATEVMERHQEKLLALGPLLEHLENEFLVPAVTRLFGILLRNHMLPEIPESIQGMEMKVEFQSVLAQAQKMTGSDAIRQLIAFAAEISKVAPDIFDKLDLHEAIDQLGDMLGVPPGIVRSDEVVDLIQRKREKAMQAQQQAEQMQMMADSAQKLGNAKMAGGQTSVLDGMNQQMGGALSGQMPFGAP